MSTPQVAVVGCDRWSRSLVRNLGRSRALGATVDPTEERYELVQAIVSGERVEVELETLLSDDVSVGVGRHPCGDAARRVE